MVGAQQHEHVTGVDDVKQLTNQRVQFIQLAQVELVAPGERVTRPCGSKRAVIGSGCVFTGFLSTRAARFKYMYSCYSTVVSTLITYNPSGRSG